MPYLLGEPALVLSKLEGEEAFSTLYSYTITAKTPANPLIPWQAASNVDLKSLIGKEMTIEMELDGNGLGDVRSVGKGTREITGLVERARYIGRDAIIRFEPRIMAESLVVSQQLQARNGIIQFEIRGLIKWNPHPIDLCIEGAYDVETDNAELRAR
ncbi:ImpA family type VI secretion-associated protein [Yersinia pseudotuberculosis]|nr:hypothetical protein FOB73_11510 [Yersinia pseudotuberculosis]CFU86186.1 ImpA family type VI secretion-associated protein [Yersinia pseudotuberculosis]CNB34052.1 ImpA family type VI secretion-associated protein [Yersinia pseudotuberculosis]CNB40763.1 ImpA family type VI secretion-associated protein [Yersinia pseudotuberculosis]CRY58547.1 ImpA family type VI secretion-associated protein [Yersinia pseudotuberculosis]